MYYTLSPKNIRRLNNKSDHFFVLLFVQCFESLNIHSVCGRESLERMMSTVTTSIMIICGGEKLGGQRKSYAFFCIFCCRKVEKVLRRLGWQSLGNHSCNAPCNMVCRSQHNKTLRRTRYDTPITQKTLTRKQKKGREDVKHKERVCQ